MNTNSAPSVNISSPDTEMRLPDIRAVPIISPDTGDITDSSSETSSERRVSSQDTSSVSWAVPHAAGATLSAPQPVKSSLAVPRTVKANVGVNRPREGGSLLTATGGGGSFNGPGYPFPLASSQQVAGSGSATGSSRNKVSLGKGFSMMDWMRLTKSGKDLTGVGGCRVGGKMREVNRAELRKHKYRKDAWMALNGMVFNVTSYMDFHPGGWDELVRGAGKDATDLFNEYHRWVNYQGLLEACLVGKLVDGPEPSKPSKPTTEFITPIPVLPPIPSKPPTPSIDFFQTESKITLNIYTKRKGLNKDCVTVDNSGEVVRAMVNLSKEEKLCFSVHLRLTARVETKVVLRVGASSGKVEVDLVKERQERWSGLGTGLDRHLWCGQVEDLPMTYRPWVVREVSQITRDTKQFLLDPPAGTLFSVPLGHHIHIKTEVVGVGLTTSYTPVRPLTLNRESDPNTGHLQLLIKIYPDGAVTPILDKLAEGDTVQISDHTGSFHLSQLKGRSKLLLLAAGTGCTPIFSLLPYLLTIPGIHITLLYFNKTRKDIIWREELDSLHLQREELTVVHVLSEEPGHTPGGRVNRELLANHMGEVVEIGRRFAAVCGPVGFVKETDRLLREEFGFISEDLHLFQG